MTTPHRTTPTTTPTVHTIATDGAHNPATGVTTWAWVAHDTTHNTGTIPPMSPATPLTAELCALDDALTHAPRTTPVRILIDSKDVLRLINHNRTPRRAHRKLVTRIRRNLTTRPAWAPATLTYVKAHAGHTLNEAADTLAVTTRRHYENPTAA